MAKTLGGFLIIRDGHLYDYNYMETIESLCGFCEEVSVCFCGGNDGTDDVLRVMETMHENLTVTYMTDEDWFAHKGKERLSHFQDVAAMKLTTDYVFLCQADEVVKETCIPAIREAMEMGHEGYLCKRINLWHSPYLQLDVPQDRKPCSTEVIRLAKRGCKSYDDGENLSAQANGNYIDRIRIFHYGFVRKKEVMKAKIINMQEVIFGCGHDEKLDGHDVFQPGLWFSLEDTVPVRETHPAIMSKWILSRP